MESKKVLVVEDQLIISTSIRLTLEKKGYECRAVPSGEEAIDMMPDFSPDVILMDIGLGGKIDGISTAKIIRRQSNKPIIFITDIENEIVFQQAKAAFPSNFLRKPYTEPALLQSIELALSMPVPSYLPGMMTPFGERVSDGIFVLSGDEYKKVLFMDILYIQASGVYTLMQCTGKCYKISVSSNNVVTQLDYPGMVKANRSYYVNIHRIDSIRNNDLVVGNKTVPMSKNYRSNVLDRVTKISQK